MKFALEVVKDSEIVGEVALKAYCHHLLHRADRNTEVLELLAKGTKGSGVAKVGVELFYWGDGKHRCYSERSFKYR